MKQKNLDVINAAFRYKSIRQIRCGKELLHGGKVHHNCVGISGEIEKKQGRKLDPRITSQIIWRGKKYIRKGLRRGQFLKGKFIPLTKEEHENYMRLEDPQARGDFIKGLKRKGWKMYEQTNRIFGGIKAFNKEADQKIEAPIKAKKGRPRRTLVEGVKELSSEEYKKRFGHSLDSDGKEFEKSGYKRIRPGARVFISSGPSPSLASSAPHKAKEKTAEAQPH